MQSIDTKIVMMYITPFVTPLQRLKIDKRKDVMQCVVEDFAKYIHSFGFPAYDIFDFLKNYYDSYIAGSFVLDFLTQLGKHENRKWSANDIDLFTSVSKNVLKKELFDKATDYCGKQYDDFFDYRHNAEEIMYTNHFRTNIKDLKTVWNCRRDKTLQIISVDDARKTINNNFDFDFVKAKFDGSKFIIEPEVEKAIIDKMARVNYIHGTPYMLNRSLRRAVKYQRRGYRILLPSQVLILTDDEFPSKWTELFDRTYNTGGKIIQSSGLYIGNGGGRGPKPTIDVNICKHEILHTAVGDGKWQVYQMNL